MTISAKVIADSLNPKGVRLTTLQLRYPRFIHAEVMTHRAFSRNASSSRAIPVERLIKDVMDDPAIPIHWGKNQPGMQAREEHDALVKLRGPFILGAGLSSPEVAWLRARDMAVDVARSFTAADYHKQIVNRLLEPFAHINVVVTATEWSNFFALRDHPDAQPEIMRLAKAMSSAMWLSNPRQLLDGEWHLPYVDRDTCEPGWLMSNGQGGVDGLPPAVRISTARCARVSYLTHEGKEPDAEKDFNLFNDLMGGDIKHASPAEHPCVARDDDNMYRNLRGFASARVFVPQDTL